MKYYIAVDIGCIECGEYSFCLGVFDSEKKAQDVCDEHEKRQDESWHGEHSFEVFEIDRLNKVHPVDYDK